MANPLLHNNAFWPLWNNVFKNIMENGAFAPKKQMLHFPYFQKYSKLNLNFS